MLSAASARLRGRDTPSTASSSTTPSSSSSSSHLANRRLSRLSPSEFDSILDSQHTKVLHTSGGRDESQLGVAHDVPPSPDPSSPQHSPDLSRTTPTATSPLAARGAAVPPLLAPEQNSPDAIKRRSMFRSVGNASSPDLSSLLKKAKEGSGGRIGTVPAAAEEQEVLEDVEGGKGAYEDADGEGGFSSPSRPPARSRSTTSPTISRIASRSSSAATTTPTPLPTSSSQLSIPSSASAGPDSRDSTLASRSPVEKPRLSSLSTFSTGSYVHVPFPPAAAVSPGGAGGETLSPPSTATTGGRGQSLFGGQNASVTSLGQGIGFDFSPAGGRRKKSNAGEGEDGKISLAGTMRKTSRFFRKFGGGGGGSSALSTTFPSFSKSSSSPSTPSNSVFPSSSSSASAASAAPPVPPIPTSYSRAPQSPPPTTARKTPSTRLPLSNAPAANEPPRDSSSLDISIRRPSSSSAAPAPATGSVPLARDSSQQSFATTTTTSTSTRSSSTHRRRSLSLNSVSLAAPSSAPPPASTSQQRRPSASPRTGEEDDQLRRELRQWRLGVDGVLGVGAGNTPSPRLSPAAANRARLAGGGGPGASPDSSPTAQRRSPAALLAGGGMDRRPSLPEGKALPPPPSSAFSSAGALLAQRSASLPTSSLLLPRPLTAPMKSTDLEAAVPLERSQSGPPSSVSPSLSAAASPSSPSSPSSSTLTLPAHPATLNLAALALSSSQVHKRHSIAEPEGIGLGVALQPIEEREAEGGRREREGSVATISAVGAGAAAEGRDVGGKTDGREVEGEGEGEGEAEGAGTTPTQGKKTVPLPSLPLPRPSSSSSSLQLPPPVGLAPTNANGGVSNRRAGVVRGSIVALAGNGGGSLPSSSAGASSSSLALASSTGPRRKRQPTKGEDEDAALSEEDLQAKAREAARKVWEGDEGFLERRKVAVWLGSAGRINVAALRYYIDNFDFAGLRLDVAFRRLCTKLYLKAETQQVDRILEQFSRRYFADNPKTVYSSADVVHAVSYSLLLLNTDLHVVDTTTRMTRQQFIRNTVEAIKAQTGDGSSANEVVQTPVAAPALLFSSPNPSIAADDAADSTAVFGSPDASSSHKSLERPRTAASGRSSSLAAGAKDSPASSSLHLPASPVLSRSGTTASTSASALDSPTKPSPFSTSTATPMRSESLLTVNSTLSNNNNNNSKSLEANLQATLKDMYNAIKSQPIYQSSSGGSASASASALNLPGSNGAGDYTGGGGRPSLSLTPGNSPYATWSSSGGVNRSASRRSGAATSTISVGSGGGGGGSSYKRSSVRGLGGFLGTGAGAGSDLELARTVSPTPSTNTSLSDEHWSTAYGVPSQHHAVPTIGFANSLSHTIIREQQEDDAKSDRSSSISVSSAELALLGAPWAKEGILHRKHYWETTGKRSKDKSWVQAFVVVAQGELKMFKFDSGGGMRGGMGGIGGGDWTSNASSVGAVSLIHALCSAMPAPGYSKDRPHCFVLTLPNGGSYFFQAGTPDLVAEWVATCNYWSGRLSKEPLSGGVSNMEYGWNRVEPPSRDDDDDDDYEEIASIRSGHSRMSHAGSMFSSHGSGGGGNPNDRIHINDWKPPQVPLTPSNLPEEAQLDALKRHAAIVHKELEHHNTLRSPMTRLYSHRSSNGSKALANWERKSQHLLAETVKWTTYIDALSSAVRLRSIQRGKKEVEHMLEQADVGDEDDDDELAASLSPYEQPPASIKVDAPPLPPPSASPAHSKTSVTRPARFDSTTSQASVATATTVDDEYFDSTADTPP